MRSEFLEGGPPVKAPVTPSILLSNCSLKSPSRHIQSRGGISDSSFCSLARVSFWEGAILPLCGKYTATTNRLHVGPSNLTQHVRSPRDPNEWTFFCIRGDRRIPTPAARSFGYRGLPLFGPFLCRICSLTINSLLLVWYLLWCRQSSVSAVISLPRDFTYSNRSLVKLCVFQVTAVKLDHPSPGKPRVWSYSYFQPLYLRLAMRTRRALCLRRVVYVQK